MGDWAELENESSDVLTEYFGERVRLMPRAKTDISGRTAADNTRDEVVLEAIFEWIDQHAFIGKGKTQARATGAEHVQTRNPVLFIEERDLPAGTVLKEGDRFAMLDGANAGLYFEALSFGPDGQGRIAIQLQQVGKHPIART